MIPRPLRIALFTLAAPIGAVIGQGRTTPQAEAASVSISSTLRAYAAAIVKGDPDSIAAFYTPDGSFNCGTACPVREAFTRSGVRDAWREFTRRWEWTAIAPVSEQLEVFGDAAYDYGIWPQTYTTKATGAANNARLRYSAFWRRQSNGEWRIHRFFLVAANPQ